jgi:hypothetical protein
VVHIVKILLLLLLLLLIIIIILIIILIIIGATGVVTKGQKHLEAIPGKDSVDSL